MCIKVRQLELKLHTQRSKLYAYKAIAAELKKHSIFNEATEKEEKRV